MSITLDGNNLTTSGLINSLPAQNSTSGTSIDFTGIPAGVRSITVIFNGVSTSGTNRVLIQIGSGSVVTSGYNSSVSSLGSAVNSTSGITTSTSGFIFDNGYTPSAADARIALYILTLAGGNIWMGTGSMGNQSTVLSGYSSALSGALDRVRITTVGGTDTFDAGSISVLYQ